jgi:hypothetical protein
LDLCDVSERVLTVAAVPVWQNARKQMKATSKLAKRFPEFNFMYPSPELTPTS